MALHAVLTRCIDELGRIVIPAEARRMFEINAGDLLVIEPGKNGYIIIRKLIDGEQSIMARRIDSLGRIVIPAETRRLFHIVEGDELIITVDDDGFIAIAKLSSVCTFCGNPADDLQVEGKGVCNVCGEAIAEVMAAVSQLPS